MWMFCALHLPAFTPRLFFITASYSWAATQMLFFFFIIIILFIAALNSFFFLMAYLCVVHPRKTVLQSVVGSAHSLKHQGVNQERPVLLSHRRRTEKMFHKDGIEGRKWPFSNIQWEISSTLSDSWRHFQFHFNHCIHNEMDFTKYISFLIRAR